MSDLFPFALSLIAGLVLGLLYYAGLWLTVKRAFTSRSPALLFLSSFIVRAAVILAGLYAVSSGYFVRIAGYLIGFLLARLLATWRFMPASSRKVAAADASSKKEANL